jgi:hypothetical protein
MAYRDICAKSAKCAHQYDIQIDRFAVLSVYNINVTLLADKWYKLFIHLKLM